MIYPEFLDDVRVEMMRQTARDSRGRATHSVEEGFHYAEDDYPGGRIDPVHANVADDDFAGVSQGWQEYY